MYRLRANTVIVAIAVAAAIFCAQHAFAGGFDVNAGEAKVNSGALSVDGDINVAAGAALTNSGTVELAGDWTVNAAGLFIDSGTVTFDGALAQNVSSGGTDANHDFNSLIVTNASPAGLNFTDAFKTIDFTCNTASANLNFGGGLVYTISGLFTLNGQAAATRIKLRSLASPARFTFDVTAGIQHADYVNVQDSQASTNSIVALNSFNAGNNDNLEPAPHWVFGGPTITYPITGKTVGRDPTIMGTTGPGDVVDIFAMVGGVSTKVATVTADSNGSYRVRQSHFTALLDLGANSLTPSVGGVAGSAVNVTIVNGPTTDQVPTIVTPADNTKVSGNRPVISGKGLAGKAVVLYANDANGNLLLANVAAGAVDASGNYTINSADYTTDLPKGTVYLSVVVDDVSSLITTVSLVDPFGVVFDSVSNDPIGGAVVTIYDSAGAVLVPGVAGAGGCVIAAADVNPQTVGASGFYSYLCGAAAGYTISVSAPGYAFPSSKSSFPAGRVITGGSKGAAFAVGAAVIEMDMPMDPQRTLLKIRKEANKKEVTIGEVVTYTVTIENLTKDDIEKVYIEDNIPAGFKYIDGRAVLDGARLGDPSGPRPESFDIGTVKASSTKTLKYQLVVGSGVTFGNYENRAYAKYVSGDVISNLATANVKIVADPLFDTCTVIGKVFWDLNGNGVQDPPEGDVIERGVPGVRVASEDGAVVTTDDDGKFHIPMILPGTHVYRIDEGSIPAGTYLTTKRERILELTRGILAKANFGIAYNDEDKAATVSGAGGRAGSALRVVKEPSSPKPRLNASLYKDALVVHNGRLDEAAEFRIFTNYSLCFDRWRLEIADKELNKPVAVFEGKACDIFRPIRWDGRDSSGKVIRPDRTYCYTLTVFASNGTYDMTKKRDFTVTAYKEGGHDGYNAPFEGKRRSGATGSLLPESDTEKKAAEMARWVEEESRSNNLDRRGIVLNGGEVKVFSRSPVRALTIAQGGKEFGAIPVNAKSVSAQGLAGRALETDVDEGIDLILPRGTYSIGTPDNGTAVGPVAQSAGNGSGGQAVSGEPSQPVGAAPRAQAVTIGDDYFFLVGMGQGILRGNTYGGNIEPVQNSKEFRQGLYAEGKLAYYLKAKIQGKYLIASSLDTTRQQKELSKVIDPDKYYPIYGDASQSDYSAQDTQGQFYALVEWDKSSVTWGNYDTDFSDTTLATYKRTLYGGRMALESLSTTQFGQPDTKIAAFWANAKQMGAHNEFLGTGGSLYYLKHKYVVEGSEKVEIQARDKINGLVLASASQKRGSDYQINYDDGRIIFWKPISYIADTTTIISSQAQNGNPVYVVIDYEYEVKNKYDETAEGARVSQQITDYARVGGTYVKENKDKEGYELAAGDATLRLGKKTKIDAEYAMTRSEATGNFISTDGGITFTAVNGQDDMDGKAASVKGDTSLLDDRLAIGAYAQKVGKGFATAGTVADQGSEKAGVRATFALTPRVDLVAWHDFQKLVGDGNPQSATQIGAKETQETTAQAIYHGGAYDVTSEFRSQRSNDPLTNVTSETNANLDTAAMQVDWRANKMISLMGRGETSVWGEDMQRLTGGVTLTPQDKLKVTLTQSVGTDMPAFKAIVDYDVNDMFSLSASRAMDKSGPATELGAKADLNKAVRMTASVKRSEETADVASLGAEAKIDEDQTVYANLSKEGATPTTRQKDVIITGQKRQLGNGVEYRSERSFIRSDRELSSGTRYALSRETKAGRMEISAENTDGRTETGTSDTNIFGLSGDVGEKVSLKTAVENGVINNLDGTKTNRTAASLNASYVEKDAFRSSVKLESRFDSGSADVRQLLGYIGVEGRVSRDLSLFNKTNISQTENTATSAVAAQYKEILTGFAYRPVYFDRWNIIGKYTYLENAGPSGQADYTDVSKMRANILGLETIYDYDDENQIVAKLAGKQAEEWVPGFDGPTDSKTWLAILRLNRKFLVDYELALEYRVLGQCLAEDSRQGALVEVNRYFSNWLKLGVGYNFSGFNDDLAHQDYNAYGWYVKATSSLGEIAQAMKQTHEERVAELKRDGKQRHARIMALPSGEARVQEVMFYRDQAKFWMRMGEYKEAYSCLEEGQRLASKLQLGLLKEEMKRIDSENREKIDRLIALDDKVRSVRKDGLSKATSLPDPEERRYKALQTLFETGKMYFDAAQYDKALREWGLGLELVEDANVGSR